MPAHLILFDLITVIIFGKDNKARSSLTVPALVKAGPDFDPCDVPLNVTVQSKRKRTEVLVY
jgi:hypothetical protein